MRLLPAQMGEAPRAARDPADEVGGGVAVRAEHDVVDREGPERGGGGVSPCPCRLGVAVADPGVAGAHLALPARLGIGDDQEA